jgi:hypothetical protein
MMRARTWQPLEGLYMTLQYLEQFNWEEHALGLFGPISLSALPAREIVMDGPCAWPKGAKPLLSQVCVCVHACVCSRLVGPAVGVVAGWMSAVLAQSCTSTFGALMPRSLQALLQQYAGPPESEPFLRKYINVVDPTNPNNNLGRSIRRARQPRWRAVWWSQR